MRNVEFQRKFSWVWSWWAQYQTEESCLSVPGSSAQNPRLVGPVKHRHSTFIRTSRISLQESPKGHKNYRKCCGSWSTFVVVILRISQLWGHYDPASLWTRLWNLHIICDVLNCSFNLTSWKFLKQLLYATEKHAAPSNATKSHAWNSFLKSWYYLKIQGPNTTIRAH